MKKNQLDFFKISSKINGIPILVFGLTKTPLIFLRLAQSCKLENCGSLNNLSFAYVIRSSFSSTPSPTPIASASYLIESDINLNTNDI